MNVKVIRYLDELQHKTIDTIIDKMIPNLIKELKLNEMQIHILQTIFQLLYIQIDSNYFQQIVFPAFIQFFEKRTSKTFKIIVKHIEIITKNCNFKQRQQILLNLYVKCLKIRFNISLQKLVLTELSDICYEVAYKY